MKVLESIGNAIWQNIRSEPLVWIGLVDAGLLAGVTFGLTISPDQKAAIDGVLQIVAVLVARSQVTPNVRLAAPKS